MSKPLYEYAKEFLDILDVAEEVEEDTLKDHLDIVQMEGKDKALNVAKWIKEKELMVQSMHAAYTTIQQRKLSLEKQIKWMRRYLSDNMQHLQIASATDAQISVSTFLSRPKPEITDEVPKQFVSYEMVVPHEIREIIGMRSDVSEKKEIVDKKAITQFLEQEGDKVWGKLVRDTHVRIK